MHWKTQMTQDEIQFENFEKIIGFIIRKFPIKSNSYPDKFTGEFHQTFSKDMISIPH